MPNVSSSGLRAAALLSSRDQWCDAAYALEAVSLTVTLRSRHAFIPCVRRTCDETPREAQRRSGLREAVPKWAGALG